MVEIALPANSRVKKGVTHTAEGTLKSPRTLKVYRLNTDDATKPHNRVTNETLCYCGETPEHILVVN